MTVTNPLTHIDVHKLLVVGDMHGNLDSWKRDILPVYARHADLILQVGDFGYGWDDWYLSALDQLLDACDGTVVWLDGNHENFDQLEGDGAFAQPPKPEPVQTSDRTWYLPRGQVWDWHGTRCMALGGAYSVDKPYRTQGVSWWPQEELTDVDVESAVAACGPEGVDVMFTHDAYDGLRVPGIHADWKQDDFGEVCRPNRVRVRTVVDYAKPDLLIHGHFHQNYQRADTVVPQVVGLNREYEPGAMLLMTFSEKEYTWAWVDEYEEWRGDVAEAA